MITHGCVKYALAFATSELDGAQSSVSYPGGFALGERAPRINCIELEGTQSRYEHDTEAHIYIYINLYNYSKARHTYAAELAMSVLNDHSRTKVLKQLRFQIALFIAVKS
jgi:hypothetical protein